jgi:hypothetical protein
MKFHAWALVLSLGLLVATTPAQAQQENRQDGSVQLERNFPNPFNPETTIPFTLGEVFWEGGARPVVSLRIYNVLAQLVAVPVLQGTGELVENLELDWNGTGRYRAFWDGKILQTNREAASGVYVYQLIVNGRSAGMKKMAIIK